MGEMEWDWAAGNWRGIELQESWRGTEQQVRRLGAEQVRVHGAGQVEWKKKRRAGEWGLRRREEGSIYGAWNYAFYAYSRGCNSRGRGPNRYLRIIMSAQEGKRLETQGRPEVR